MCVAVVCVCRVCMQSIAVLEEYIYPTLLDTETVVILILCLLLLLGSITLLFIAIRQRYLYVCYIFSRPQRLSELPHPEAALLF